LWCHYSPQNIDFRNSGYVILYLQPRPVIDGYPFFTGPLFFFPVLMHYWIILQLWTALS